MSSEQLIPNAVGRLDDVVEALKNGDVAKAQDLLFERGGIVVERRDAISKEWSKADAELRCVHSFAEKIGRDKDFAYCVRVACGGGTEVNGDE